MHRSSGSSVSWKGQRARLELSPMPAGSLRAAIIPESVSGPLGPAMVRRCVERLVELGVAEVSTPAMIESEASGFSRAGFEVTTRLHLLTHDLATIPGDGPTGPRTFRATPGARDQLLRIDHAAFIPEWRMDERSFQAATAATSVVRIRVTGARDAPVGFAITGRAGRRGYLQRLGVDPAAQHQGHGRALVADCLHWCRRWRTRRVVVNTHEGNDVALSLYRAMGFELSDFGLVVLRLSLDAAPRDSSGPGS